MKKMRKLLPALAMLLVSAIMMSTASFAWFTMNETVTATGMQVQAKASGNLLINTAPLNSSHKSIEVTVTNTDKYNLTPITYDKVNSKWMYAGEDATIDTLYGNVTDGDLTEYLTPATAAPYFAEYTVYLATAGDLLQKCDVFAKINGIGGIDQAIAPAYTIAFWVLANDEATPDWSNPTYTLSYRDGQTDKVLITDATTERVDVPSTYNVGLGDEIGVKVVMRIYVDGALVKGDKTVQVPDIKAVASNTTWGALKTAIGTATGAAYAEDTHTVYKNGVAVSTSLWDDAMVIDTTYSYQKNGATKPDTVEEYYVNNQNIPNDSTTFEVEFSVKENKPTP